MKTLRELLDRVLGRGQPSEEEPQPTFPDESGDEQRRESLRKHEEKVARGDPDEGRYENV